jgi:CubicO group peptidase (beta-lactamase class C family)
MSDLVEAIEKAGREYCSTRKELTLVVGLTQGGKRQFFGFRSPDARYAPMPDSRSLYEIGSVSKLYTTSLLSILVSKGVLSLEDTVAQYFPDLDLKPEIAGITVFDLATHSSGLDGDGVVLARMIAEAVESGDVANYTYYERYAKEDLDEELRLASLSYPARQGWEYSRTGLSILGRILELASGEDYEQLLRTHITGPLGLADTAYTLTEEQQSRVVHGYYEDGTPSMEWKWGVMLPQGGIRSTVDDMLTFAEANLADDDSQLTTDLRRARETEFAWPEGHTMPDTGAPPHFDQALGWMNLRTGVGPISYHPGGTFSYAALLGVHQQTKTGLVAMTASATNLDDLEAGSLPVLALGLLIQVAVAG